MVTQISSKKGLRSRKMAGPALVPRRVLAEDQAFEVALLAPTRKQVEECQAAIRIVGLEKALPFVCSLAVVVSRGAGVLVLGHDGRSGYQFYPLFLGFKSGLDRFGFAFFNLRNEMSDVLGLLLQQVGEVRREACLGHPHMHAVRKAMGQEAMERSHPLRPIVRQ